ncbi:hypothetical protein L1887_29265 [Cichorium endivia]|nr:hypothetical protein L1887_29265 [Cichorium endivia]
MFTTTEFTRLRISFEKRINKMCNEGNRQDEEFMTEYTVMEDIEQEYDKHDSEMEIERDEVLLKSNEKKVAENVSAKVAMTGVNKPTLMSPWTPGFVEECIEAEKSNLKKKLKFIHEEKGKEKLEKGKDLMDEFMDVDKDKRIVKQDNSLGR